jgi:hypothetical protein
MATFSMLRTGYGRLFQFRLVGSALSRHVLSDSSAKRGKDLLCVFMFLTLALDI